MRLGRALAIVVLGVLVACAARRQPAPEAWLAPIAGDHPLVGTIADAAGRPVARAALVDRLVASEFVLLGDKHDNPDHHRLQAEVVDALAARGRRPAVAFEPITVDRSPALATALAEASPTSQRVIESVSSAATGWPWDLYEPIVAAALRAGLPIVAADLDPAWVRTIQRQGLAGLDPALVDRLLLREPRPDAAGRAQLADDIRRDHCGHAPAAALERMVDAQRARDAQLARALVDAVAAGADGAVLIAGGGHVRRDVAVPLHLARWAPGATTVTVAFVEVPFEQVRLADAFAALFDGDVPFDYVWFTPRVDTSDPCELFREQLERMHTPPPGSERRAPAS